MKKIALVLFFCNMSIYMFPQYSDTSRIQETINAIIMESYTDSLVDLFLVNKPLPKLMENTSKVDVYKGLKDFFTEEQLDNFNDSSSAWSKSINWDRRKICINVIDVHQTRLLMDSNLLWSRIHNENKKRKRKKKEHRMAAIIYASIPIIVDNYCLILLSSSSGGTNGRQCLYLYKREGEGWKVKKTITCRFM